MVFGKCPHCKAGVDKVVFKSMPAVNKVIGATASVSGLAFLCPGCSCVLGFQVDPLKVRDEIIAALSDE